MAWISDRSGYQIHDVLSLNWDIALMLTPWGLLHNLLLVHDHYLKPYYDQASQRGHFFEDPGLSIAVILTALGALFGLRQLRGSSGGS